MVVQKLNLQIIRRKLKDMESILSNRLQAASDEYFEPAPDHEESGIDDLYDSWKRSRVVNRQEEERLRQVQAALRRLDQGTFGKCAKCSGEINPERLNALPYVELCIRCQRKQENSIF